MITMTIATDRLGNVIGAIQHPAHPKGDGGPQCGVDFAPDHVLHTVEVGPEMDMAKAKDSLAFHESLKRYVTKAR